MSNQLPQLKGLKMHEIRIYLGILGMWLLAREALSYLLRGAIRKWIQKPLQATYNVRN